MTSKKWTIIFLGIIIIVLTSIAILNVVVDPFGYFDAVDGLNYELNDNSYMRVLKGKHIKKYGNNYDAFLLGGSKAGGYTSEKLKELDGYNYYNTFFTCGNFEEYYIYTKLIVEETEAKKIVLNLSGFECLFDVRDGLKQQTPAMLTGKSEIAEFISLLFKNPEISINEIKNPTFDYRQNDDGSRNLEGTYEEYYKNPSEFVKNKVVHKLESNLKTMFENAETRTFSSFPNDIKYLTQIVELCKENNIELLVINSPTSVMGRQDYEGEAYWNFLIQVASVTDFWDFTSYNDINLNPYNFYDDSHSFYEVSDLVIDTIKGTNSYEGFGQYITSENIYKYIEERRNDFYELKYEFEQTGTVTLKSQNNQSNLLRNGGTISE